MPDPRLVLVSYENARRSSRAKRAQAMMMMPRRKRPIAAIEDGSANTAERRSTVVRFTAAGEIGSIVQEIKEIRMVARRGTI